MPKDIRNGNFADDGSILARGNRHVNEDANEDLFIFDDRRMSSIIAVWV
jgi:hypothetical protein